MMGYGFDAIVDSTVIRMGTITDWIQAGKEALTKRRTGGRRGVETGKANTFGRKAIQVRCPDIGITVAAQVSESHVIRQEKK